MDANQLQEEINSLARDIQERVFEYMKRTGGTHTPQIQIQFVHGTAQYIGHEPADTVAVNIAATLTAEV